MKNIISIPCIIVMIIAFASFGQVQEKENAKSHIIDINVEQATHLINKDKVRVIDVRTPDEFESGHISEAILINVRGDDFATKIAGLDLSLPYIVHCSAGVDGGRSRKAVEELKAKGATKIYHLNGGIDAWIKEKHPIQN